MTSNADDTSVVIEYDVPVPTSRQNDREKLPELPFTTMREGGSFLLETKNDEHTTRKLSAVRSAVSRFVDANTGFAFRVFRWKDESSGKQGVRVFRIRDSEANE